MFLQFIFTAFLYKVSIVSTVISKDLSIINDADKAVSGEKFIKDIINGKQPEDKPEYLLFTAPFQLCEGECKSNATNFAMVFPIRIGLNKSKLKYKSLYPRDHHNIHSSADGAPFKTRTTMPPYTLCPTTTPEKDKEIPAPSVGPGCSVKISKITFRDEHFITKNYALRYGLFKGKYPVRYLTTHLPRWSSKKHFGHSD